MPDYGHSKGYALLPNFCPETTPKVEVNGMTRKQREANEEKDKLKREKESKIEFIVLQKIVNNNRIDVKNREKYDV